MHTQRVAVVAGARTPFARAGGALEAHDAMALSLHAVEGLNQRVGGVLERCEALRWGIVVLEPRIPHFARDVVLRARLPSTVRAVTLTDNCITGATAVADLAMSIRQGHTGIAIAGGVESMSNPPLLFRSQANRIFMRMAMARSLRAKAAAALRLRPQDFLPEPPSVQEPSTGLSMGEHCELMVRQWSIGRQAQDEFALRSHQRAAAARRDGTLGAEIHPFSDVSEDGLIRADGSLEKLAALRPVFDRSGGGTITAGTSSPLTDGAAVLLLAGERSLEREGLTPLAWLKDQEFASINPSDGLLMAPALAVPRLLARNGLRLEDLDLVEVHEAFAGQVLCNLAAWSMGWKESAIGQLRPQQLNPLGGSIALGHPFSATGIRLVLSAATQLARGEGRFALVSICGAGATGAALLLERP